jgi:ESAT-6 protein secretion system EspG family protein
VTVALEQSPACHGVDLGLVEVDLIATLAGAAVPFPLRVPVAGRTDGERRALLDAAGDALRARGLADRDGPAGLAAELGTALRDFRGAVDVVVLGTVTVTGALALVRGDRAVVCRQRLCGAESGTVRVERVTAATLTDALAELVPDVPPAPTMPITLPPGVAGAAVRVFGEEDDPDTARHRVRELVRAGGGTPDVVDELTELLPVLTGRGQLGVVRRAGARATRPVELSWLDSPQGRVRVDHDDTGWVSVNPLRRGEIVRVLRDMAATARAS